MRRLTRLGSTAALCAALLLASGCGKDANTRPGTGSDVGDILDDVSHGVILATYLDMETEVTVLADAVTALRAAPSEATLTAAREAWRHARTPWEQSEAFLFGPVETAGLDPAIDSWPVNTVDLDHVLGSPSELTPEFVQGLEGTLKGFHTCEYLLFGEGGRRTAASLTPRQLDYLAAATIAMKAATRQLALSWSPAGGDFAGTLSGAGEGGSVYVSQKAALQELITGMTSIADEVANGKIHDPFSTQDVTLEESRFSANSLADFQDNIRSLQHIYHGRYGDTDGRGVDDFVARLDADLDTRLTLEIDAAIAAIGAVPPPFTTALTLHPADVTAAQSAVRRVQQTLEEHVAPLLDRF